MQEEVRVYGMFTVQCYVAGAGGGQFSENYHYVLNGP